MWYGLCASTKADPDFVRSASELLESTSRRLILAAGGAYLICYLTLAYSWPERYAWAFFGVTLVITLTCGSA